MYIFHPQLSYRALSREAGAISHLPTPTDWSKPSRKRSNWIDAVYSLHPVHTGTYSVERLPALSKYCSGVSPLRVVLVCFLLPAPALLIAVAQECIPLQDPTDGWKASIGAWIRLRLIGFSCSVALIVQTNAMVPLSKVSKAKTVFASDVAALAYVSAQMIVASAWVYSIPLAYVWFVPLFSSALAIMFLLMIGPNAFRSNPTLGFSCGSNWGSSRSRPCSAASTLSSAPST